MKRFIEFVIKAITCIWAGMLLPLTIMLPVYIRAEFITRSEAFAYAGIYIAVLLILGVLWVDKK